MKVNASKAIPMEHLAAAIYEMVLRFGDEEEKKFFEAIDEAGDSCEEEIEKYLSKGHGLNTGHYRSQFKIAKEQPERHRKTAEWYVDEPDYRLTHLLENGHLTRDGTSRTEPVKHIKYGRKIAEQVLKEKMKGLWG